MKKQVGNFTGEVNGPYPCWVEINYDGQVIKGIRHNEIADLEYLVKRLKKEAKLLLKDDAGQV